MKACLDVTVNSREIDRLAIGTRIYDVLDMSQENNSIKYDKENGNLIIPKEKIIEMFELVNNRPNKLKDMYKAEVE